MKRTNGIIFVIFTILSVSVFYSCSSKKVGFFNNTYQRYEVRKVTPDQPAPVTASAAPAVSEKAMNSPVITRQNVKESIAREKASASEEQKAILYKPAKEERVKAKNEFRKFLKEHKADERSGINTLLLVIIAILLPPLAVLLVDGLRGPFWLSILLTLLFYLPGLIYALYRIFRKQ